MVYQNCLENNCSMRTVGSNPTPSAIGPSSSGRTADSGSVNLGSNPNGPASKYSRVVKW